MSSKNVLELVKSFNIIIYGLISIRVPKCDGVTKCDDVTFSGYVGVYGMCLAGANLMYTYSSFFIRFYHRLR